MMGAPESGLGPMFGPQQRYNMMQRILETAGIKDHQAILQPPQNIPPPQPSPAEMMQMQAAQKQLEIAERQTQVAEGRVMNERQRTMLQAQDARNKLRQKEIDARRQFGLDTRELEHEIYVDNEELRMAREVPAPERRAIVSPA